MIKDHVSLRRTFGKYRTVIPTREEWYKDWPQWLRKGRFWFTYGTCNQLGTGAGICKYQSKIQWHISLTQDATVFQAEVVGILDCVTSCLRKILVKEQITIRQPSNSCSPSSQWNKITARSRLYRNADSFVRSKPGNHNVGTWA